MSESDNQEKSKLIQFIPFLMRQRRLKKMRRSKQKPQEVRLVIDAKAVEQLGKLADLLRVGRIADVFPEALGFFVMYVEYRQKGYEHYVKKGDDVIRIVPRTRWRTDLREQ